MPVLVYLTVVAPVLLILICGSDILLGPPKGLDLGTAWHGLPNSSRRAIEDYSHRNDDYRPIPLPPEAAEALAKANAPFAVKTPAANTTDLQSEAKPVDRKPGRRVDPSYNASRDVFRSRYRDFGSFVRYERDWRRRDRSWW